MALSGDTRTPRRSSPAAYRVMHVPPPYAYRCPFGTTNAAACGVAAAQHVADPIDARGAQEVAAVLMEAERRHQRHRRARELLAGVARGDAARAACT